MHSHRKEDWEKEYDAWRERKKVDEAARERMAFTPASHGAPAPLQKPATAPTAPHQTPPVHAHSHDGAVRAIKVAVLVIPLVIVGYLLWANFVASQEFVYMYDVGDGHETYLTPASRISAPGIIDDVTYRNLTSGLVYFEIPVPRGAERVNVQVRLDDSLPKGGHISLGAKDQEVWHYSYKQIYNPALETLTELPPIESVYQLNPSLPFLSKKELLNREGIIIATDMPLEATPNEVDDYVPSDTAITIPLRGAHTFYLYARGTLAIEVKKQDINWYEGSDELELSLYDAHDRLIANATIPDDDITSIQKGVARLQTGKIVVDTLPEGVYKLEIGSFDGLIREIHVNTNKVVTDRLFLAGNSLYNVQTAPSEVYFSSGRDGQLQMITYHSAGIQTVNYEKDGKKNTFKLTKEDEPMYMNISQGVYALTFPKNDVTLSGPVYFAFSEHGYFSPFKQQIIEIGNDYDWIKENVDYVITNYDSPMRDAEGWLITDTTFDISKDNLYVQDGKLSMVLNVPHLGQEDFANYTVPIDWIEVHVEKPGVFG